ncbi:MAG: phosphatase PAP2 family protein [Hyphomicrobiales bacterium]|nr:phosphatase PAP2 family protein [Hyphomicrobiales bacterium]
MTVGQPGPARRIITIVSAHPIATCALAVVVSSVFFLAFPGVDLWVSDLFFRDADGFFMRRAGFLKLIRQVGYLLAVATAVWLIVQLVLKLLRPEQPSYVRPSITLFLLSTLVAAPALLVNVVLKNNWGRPRPRGVELFGGDAPYVEVWRITDHCASNCSFVSGETSFAFWLTALALVMPRPWRLPVGVALVILATALSVNRIVFGGHFTSDVVISAGLTLLVVAIGYRLFITNPPAWLANDRLEDGLTRLGLLLRGRRRE